MNPDVTTPMTDMFRQTAEIFTNALHTGTRFQQDMLNAMTRPMIDDRFAAEVRERGQKFVDGAFKLAQKNLEEAQKLIDGQCRQSMDLLRKALDTAKTPEGRTDAFETTRNLCQTTFDTMKASIDALARANAQTVENFTAFVNHTCNGHACKPDARADKPEARDRKVMAAGN